MSEKEPVLMDPSDFVVGGLTAISVGLLVWIELRSRRNIAAQENDDVPDELKTGS